MFRAVRRLAKEPGFTFAAVATLALGTGCSATMFSVLDAILLEPVPHVDSARVVALETRWRNTGRITPRVSGEDWLDLASAHNLFEIAGALLWRRNRRAVARSRRMGRYVLGLARILQRI
jgi:hypothetical protein